MTLNFYSYTLKCRFVAILFLFITFNLFGQFSSHGVTGSADIIVTGTLEPIAGLKAIPLNEIEYTGSPFLNEEYATCEIVFNGKKVGTMYYKYNAYNEEIQVKKNKYTKDYSALRRDKKVALISNGVALQFHVFYNKKNEKLLGYMFNLISGKYSLYKRVNVKFTDLIKAQTSFQKDIPAKFTKFDAYYYQSGNGKIKEIELKKKKLLKLVDANSKNLLDNWTDFKNKKRERS